MKEHSEVKEDEQCNEFKVIKNKSMKEDLIENFENIKSRNNKFPATLNQAPHDHALVACSKEMSDLKHPDY